jgi:hypothetical protein
MDTDLANNLNVHQQMDGPNKTCGGYIQLKAMQLLSRKPCNMTTWTNLEDTMLGETGQLQTNTA